MKFKPLTASFLALTLAVAPVSSAFARGGHRHNHNNFGVLAAGVGILAVTAAILAAPFNAVAEAPQQVYYNGPQPQYYAQAAPQQYYQPAPVYYQQPQPVYYAPAPAYYAPAPVYYRRW